jgi:hypothetical protein
MTMAGNRERPTRDLEVELLIWCYPHRERTERSPNVGRHLLCSIILARS